MTLNATGPISLGGSTAGQSINLELSQAATAQVSLNDTNVRTLAGVASGAIIVPTNFYGKSSVVIAVNDQNVDDFTGGGRNASTGYRLTSAGLAQTQSGLGSFSTVETWCTPTGEAVNYDVLVTITVGTLTSGTAGSWIALSTTRTWTRNANIGTNELCTFTVEIRRTGTSTVLDSATVTLNADAQF